MRQGFLGCTRTHSVVQAGSKLTAVLLYQTPKCRDCRCVPLCPPSLILTVAMCGHCPKYASSNLLAWINGRGVLWVMDASWHGSQPGPVCAAWAVTLGVSTLDCPVHAPETTSNISVLPGGAQEWRCAAEERFLLESQTGSLGNLFSSLCLHSLLARRE